MTTLNDAIAEYVYAAMTGVYADYYPQMSNSELQRLVQDIESDFVNRIDNEIERYVLDNLDDWV